MPYQPLQRTIWPLAPGVQVILRKAPIPLLPARHCLLASEALLALCDPESRIPAFHGFARTTACLCPRQLVPVAACRCIESAPDFLEGVLAADVCALSYLHQTPGLRRSRIIVAAAPSTGRAPRRTTPRPGLKFLECCALFAAASSRAASGCCDDTALHSSSHPFQPSWSRVKEVANHGRPGRLALLPGTVPALDLRYWFTSS